MSEQKWTAGAAYWLDAHGRAHDPGFGHAVFGKGDQPDRQRVFSKAEALRFNVEPYSLWRDLGPPPPKPPRKRRAAKLPRKGLKKAGPRRGDAAQVGGGADSHPPAPAPRASAPPPDLPPPPPDFSAEGLGAPPSPANDNGAAQAANDNGGPVYDAEPYDAPPPPPPPRFTPEMCLPQALLVTSLLCRVASRGADGSAPPRPDEVKAMAEAFCAVMNRRAAVMGGYDDLIGLAMVSAGVYMPRAMAAKAAAAEDPQKDNKKVQTS